MYILISDVSHAAVVRVYTLLLIFDLAILVILMAHKITYNRRKTEIITVSSLLLLSIMGCVIATTHTTDS